MDRDKQVGLALGIFLVGIVAAFFFRNEPNTLDQPPELQNPEQLNREIAERPHGPYLESGTEPDEPSRSAPVADSQREATVEPAGDWDPIRDVPPLAEHDSAARPDTPPAPIVVTATRAVTPTRLDQPTALPEHNHDGQSMPSNRAGSTRSVKSPAFRIHRTERGDTLSSLAHQYLGSSFRYLDLYEANRDVLRDPNDLRVGMEIKIPVSNQAAPNSGTRTDPPVESTPERAVPPKSNTDPAKVTRVKSLSQIPPIQLPTTNGTAIGRSSSAARSQ